MKKFIAVLIAAAFAGGTAVVASAAPATTDKPAAGTPDSATPQQKAGKHATKAPAHHHKVATKSKKTVKSPNPV